MDLTNIQTIKSILKGHVLWARKKLGQNFLVSKKVLKDLIETADLKKDDTVLEIGPGIGAITQELLSKVKKVIAVEKDFIMVEIIKETTKEFKSLKVIRDDILKINLEKEIPQNYKVVANIPFNITSPVIRNFLEAEKKPQSLTLIVQKEVARRICTKPREMGILAVAVQFYAEPEIVSFVSRDSFWPKPGVDAAIIKVEIRDKRLEIRDINEKEFFRLVRIGFSSPRKQLHNNLSAGFRIDKEKVEKILNKAKISPQSRPQDLSLEDWIRLYKSFSIF